MFQCALFRKAARELFGVVDTRRDPWLDFCRSAAILLVLGMHALDFGFGGTAARLFEAGWTGVDLFFVLSGFLIAKQLWAELHTTGSVRIGRFILKRGLRIWPLYFAAIAVVFLLDLGTQRSPTPLLADLFCVSDYFHHQVPGGWSLSIEEQFYLLLPLLLFSLRKLPPSVLGAIPAAWLGLLSLSRFYFMIGVAPVQGEQPFAHAFHTHTDGLAVGVILAWISVFRRDWWCSRMCNAVVPAGMIAAGLLERRLHVPAFGFTGVALLYGGLLTAGSRLRTLSRFAQSKIFYVLSRLSYGSYLNNLILVELISPYLRGLVTRHATSLPAFLVCLATFVLVSNAVAFVTFACIEAPFLRMREQLLHLPQRRILTSRKKASARSLIRAQHTAYAWIEEPSPR